MKIIISEILIRNIIKKVKFSPESVTLTLDLSFLPGTFIKEGCKEH